MRPTDADAPTINPVGYGLWMPHDNDGAHCSNCEASSIECFDATIEEQQYCYSCGCKMNTITTNAKLSQTKNNLDAVWDIYQKTERELEELTNKIKSPKPMDRVYKYSGFILIFGWILFSVNYIITLFIGGDYSKLNGLGIMLIVLKLYMMEYRSGLINE